MQECIGVLTIQTLLQLFLNLGVNVETTAVFVSIVLDSADERFEGVTLKVCSQTVETFCSPVSIHTISVKVESGLRDTDLREKVKYAAMRVSPDANNDVLVLNAWGREPKNELAHKVTPSPDLVDIRTSRSSSDFDGALGAVESLEVGKVDGN